MPKSTSEPMPEIDDSVLAKIRARTNFSDTEKRDIMTAMDFYLCNHGIAPTGPKFVTHIARVVPDFRAALDASEKVDPPEPFFLPQTRGTWFGKQKSIPQGDRIPRWFLELLYRKDRNLYEFAVNGLAAFDRIFTNNFSYALFRRTPLSFSDNDKKNMMKLLIFRPRKYFLHCWNTNLKMKSRHCYILGQYILHLNQYQTPFILELF